MEQLDNIATIPSIRERRLREKRERVWWQINEALAQVGFARATVAALMREDADEITESVHADAYDELKHVEVELEGLLDHYEDLTRATGLARIIDAAPPILQGVTTVDAAVTRIIGYLEER